jgi:hypothetical protein
MAPAVPWWHEAGKDFAAVLDKAIREQPERGGAEDLPSMVLVEVTVKTLKKLESAISKNLK